MAVNVQFKGRGKYVGKKYTYLADHLNGDVKVGDLVLVGTPGGDKVVRVCETNVAPNNPNIVYKQLRGRHISDD